MANFFENLLAISDLESISKNIELIAKDLRDLTTANFIENIDLRESDKKANLKLKKIQKALNSNYSNSALIKRINSIVND